VYVRGGGEEVHLYCFSVRISPANTCCLHAFHPLIPSVPLEQVLVEFAPAMQRFGTQIAGRLTEKITARLVRYTAREVKKKKKNMVLPSNSIP